MELRIFFIPIKFQWDINIDFSFFVFGLKSVFLFTYLRLTKELIVLAFNIPLFNVANALK